MVLYLLCLLAASWVDSNRERSSSDQSRFGGSANGLESGAARPVGFASEYGSTFCHSSGAAESS
jgi:hypothetical protein